MSVLCLTSKKYKENSGLVGISGISIKPLNTIIFNKKNNLNKNLINGNLSKNSIKKQRKISNIYDVSDILFSIKNGNSESVCLIFNDGQFFDKFTNTAIEFLREIKNNIYELIIKNPDFTIMSDRLVKNNKLKEAIIHLQNGIEFHKFGYIETQYLNINDNYHNQEYYNDVYKKYKEVEKKSFFDGNNIEKFSNNMICSILTKLYIYYLNECKFESLCKNQLSDLNSDSNIDNTYFNNIPDGFF